MSSEIVFTISIRHKCLKRVIATMGLFFSFAKNVRENFCKIRLTVREYGEGESMKIVME
jgi:hypothetical protein